MSLLVCLRAAPLTDEDLVRHPRLREKLDAIRENASVLITNLDKEKLELDDLSRGLGDRRQRLVDARTDFEDAAGKVSLRASVCF